MYFSHQTFLGVIKLKFYISRILELNELIQLTSDAPWRTGIKSE